MAVPVETDETGHLSPAPAAGAGPAAARPPDLEDLEIRLLLEGVFQHYGYDFRDYAFSSLRRRVRQRLQEEGLPTVSALQDRVLHDPACLDRLVAGLSVTVTSLFRGPGFYRAFRQDVVPLLRTYPVIRIWHAGCATGEEVYSMAVLLEEEGLYGRSRLYATDLNPTSLRRATQGCVPVEQLAEATALHRAAGGRRALDDYYELHDGGAYWKEPLRRNVVFAQHNLVTDRSFNEFNVILCRNVLIYFNRRLQERVHHLLYESLVRLGFLGLGEKETVQFTPYERRYLPVSGRERLYRKVA